MAQPRNVSWPQGLKTTAKEMTDVGDIHQRTNAQKSRFFALLRMTTRGTLLAQQSIKPCVYAPFLGTAPFGELGVSATLRKAVPFQMRGNSQFGNSF